MHDLLAAVPVAVFRDSVELLSDLHQPGLRVVSFAATSYGYSLQGRAVVGGAVDWGSIT